MSSKLKYLRLILILRIVNIVTSFTYFIFKLCMHIGDFYGNFMVNR